MKHLKTIFYALRGVVFVLLTVWQTPLSAQQVEEIGAQDMDSVEICLLTCQPHDEVYSLYGHTAIRYHDLRKGGIDAAFNYGVFNFHAPYFALRFVFGLTDYELGVFPYAAFEKEYRYFGSMVTEQVLNLSNEENPAMPFTAIITSTTTAPPRRATSSSNASTEEWNTLGVRNIHQRFERWFTR